MAGGGEGYPLLDVKYSVCFAASSLSELPAQSEIVAFMEK